jgi:hypothetical protein
MQQSYCVQDMQIGASEEILFCLNPLVIVEIRVNDAAGTRRDIVESAFKHHLIKPGASRASRTRRCHLSRSWEPSKP